MIKSKLFAGVFAIVFVSVIAMIDCAMAGERKVQVKSHAVSVTTKFHKIDVGDAEGHVIAVLESRQVWFNRSNDEKIVGYNTLMMDINFKTGQGNMNGYGVRVSENGDKFFVRHEGKTAGKGIWKGTHIYNDGTGHYKGLSGGGTWESHSLAQGISYIEAEGERIFPE